jgi:thioredoxin reductase (NADPH)
VAVVGGGDAALTDALYLSKFTSQIFLIHRRKRLRATPILQERACSLPNIEFLWERVVEEIKGDNKVEGLTLRQVKTGEISFLPVNGVFIATGFEPSTPFLKDRLRLTPQGYIITNEKMETEIPGVFAAGDIRSTSAHQAITAAAEGAIAALSAYRYLREGI